MRLSRIADCFDGRKAGRYVMLPSEAKEWLKIAKSCAEKIRRACPGCKERYVTGVEVDLISGKKRAFCPCGFRWQQEPVDYWLESFLRRYPVEGRLSLEVVVSLSEIEGD